MPNENPNPNPNPNPADGTGGGEGGGGGNQPWFATAGLSPELKGYVEHKNFKDFSSVVDSYRNLEKLHGVPQERILKLPEKLDDDKSFLEVANRLGRPEKAETYKLNFPEGSSEDFAKWARETFHNVGLTARQAEVLSAKWNERVTSMDTASKDATVGAKAQQVEKLKQEWGAAFEQNVGQAKELAQAMGITDEQVGALSDTLGVDGLNKLLHGFITKFGVQLGESKTRGTDGQMTNFTVLSPDGARARIKALKEDPAFREKYLNGDAGAQQEMLRLHEWANPGE